MRLLLVDLAGNFFPRWHAGADKPLSHARNWTLDRIRSIAGYHDRVVVCCEGRGPTWRKDKFAEYKANREPPPASLIEELRKTEEACDTEGWHVLRRDGFEADDLIASLAWWAAESDYRATILSDDKDFAQTLGPGVQMLKSDGTTRESHDVQASYGVAAGMMPQWQALCGDTADNVPGVRGCGPKTATRLLTEYGSIDGIVRAAHAGDYTGAMADKIKAADADGTLGMSLELVTLSTDALTDEECEAVLDEVERKPLATRGAPPIPDEEEDEMVDDDAGERAAIEGECEAATAPATVPVTTPEPAPMAQPAEQPQPQAQTVFAEPPPPAPSEPEHSALLQAVTAKTANGMAANYSKRLEPKSMKGAQWVANEIYESRMFPKKIKSPGDALAVIMAGSERGLGAMTSLMGIHIFDGVPLFSSHLIVGFAKAHHSCRYFRLVNSTATECTYETHREGSPEPERMTFTIDDAKTAGLVRKTRKGEPGMWQKWPGQMCRKQCKVELARSVYEDVVGGLYSPDEMGNEEVA